METEFTTVPEKFRRDLESAVRVLRDHGARCIYVFGSVTDSTGAAEANDIDIAVSGLGARSFLHAYGILLGELDHPFDLVDLESNSRFTRKLLERGRLERVA